MEYFRTASINSNDATAPLYGNAPQTPTSWGLCGRAAPWNGWRNASRGADGNFYDTPSWKPWGTNGKCNGPSWGSGAAAQD